MGPVHELNNIFVDTIKLKIYDPFYEMKLKFNRQFPENELVILTFVCKNIGAGNDSPFQRMMAWYK